MKTARTILYYIWTIIATIGMVLGYLFLTDYDNEELRKAEKKVKRREKEVKQAKKKYNLKKEEVKKVRKETDKILANMEVDHVTEDQAKSAVNRAINSAIDD
ncbi:MAG: hypothetical protein ACOCRO_00480 [Halanaerobiales bacterium]